MLHVHVDGVLITKWHISEHFGTPNRPWLTVHWNLYPPRDFWHYSDLFKMRPTETETDTSQRRITVRVEYKSQQLEKFAGFSARFCWLLLLLHKSRYVKEMMSIRSHNRLLFTKLQLLKNLKKTVTVCTQIIAVDGNSLTHWQTADYFKTLVYISKILQDTPTFTSYGINKGRS